MEPELQSESVGGLRSRVVPRPMHGDRYTRGAEFTHVYQGRSGGGGIRGGGRVLPHAHAKRHHAYTSSKVGGRYHQWELLLLVVFGTLILFALMLVFRIQEVSMWSYWSVFTPLFVLDGLIYGFLAWCSYQKWIYHRHILALHRNNNSRGERVGDFWVDDYQRHMMATSGARSKIQQQQQQQQQQVSPTSTVDQEMERAAQLREQMSASESQPTETYIIDSGGSGNRSVGPGTPSAPASAPAATRYYPGAPPIDGGYEQSQNQQQQRRLRHDTFFYRPEFMFYLMLTATAFVVFEVLLAQHLQSENTVHTPLGVVSPLIVWAGVMALALSVRVFGSRQRHDGEWWLNDDLYNSMVQRYNDYYYNINNNNYNYAKQEVVAVGDYPVKQRATGMAQQYTQSMAERNARLPPVEVVVEGGAAVSASTSASTPMPVGYNELAQRPSEFEVPPDYDTSRIDGVE